MNSGELLKMINRENFLKEQILRENIRKAISIVKNRKLKEEQYVRSIIRSLLSEAPTFKYEYFSLNQLGHFIEAVIGDFKNPKGNPEFKQSYTDLSSKHEDRETYLEYILDFANEDFKIMDADREPTPLGQSFVDKGFTYEDEEDEEGDEEDGIVKLSIEDLEDSGGDIAREPKEDTEEEIFSIGEDGEILENENEDEDDGLQRFSRESYKQIGAALRRFYPLIKKDDVINKPVVINNKEYAAGELTERDLFKIYFKINMVLWAERYEKEFFSDGPETNVDVESEEEENINDIEDNLPQNDEIGNEAPPEDEDLALDQLIE